MQYLMAANWKMYKTTAQASETLQALNSNLATLPDDREVAIFAPFTALSAAAAALKGSAIRLGGQNAYPAKEGAFTGEISPAMLQDVGCSLVLVGHSERRALFWRKRCPYCPKSGLCHGCWPGCGVMHW